MDKIQKLDKKNQKLLLGLFKSGRASFRELGRKIGVSTEMARYRLERLEKNCVLRRVTPLIDFACLGFVTYRLQLQFGTCTKEEKEDFFRTASGIKQFRWVVRLTGNWDMLMYFLVKDHTEFSKIYDVLMHKHGRIVKDRIISTTTRLYHLAPEYIRSNKAAERRLYITHQNFDKVEIDGLDVKIINALLKDGRVSLSDMASTLKMPFSTIRRRFEILKTKGIIVGFVPMIENETIGYHHFKIMIRLANYDDKNKLLTRLSQHPNVTYIFESMGKYDLEFDANFRSEFMVQKFVRELSDEIAVSEFDVLYFEEEKVVNEPPF